MNEALRLLRVYHVMKASELARELGISGSYLSEIEKGKRKVSLELLKRYSQVFQTSPSAIMMFTEAYERNGPKIKRLVGRRVVELLSAISLETLQNTAEEEPPSIAPRDRRRNESQMRAA